jgi:putative membrane protein
MVIYMASLVGFTTPHQQTWYLYYTPYFILLNVILLLIYQKEWNKSNLYFGASAIVLGFVVEVLAVQTASLYGSYNFGKTLGFRVLGVPLIMPIYWFLSALSTACLVNKLPLKNPWVLSTFGALLMVFLTGIIHQVASALDFWSISSSNSLIRLSLVWFLVGFALQYLFIRLKASAKNPMAIYVYGGLLIFFVGVFSFL